VWFGRKSADQEFGQNGLRGFFQPNMHCMTAMSAALAPQEHCMTSMQLGGVPSSCPSPGFWKNGPAER